jgi:diguanylate cyclase (GGDEF)-like protein
MLSSRSRRDDFVARYGGEEFTIVMPTTPKKTASTIADRLRKEIAETFASKKVPEGVPHLTVSVGISAFPYDGVDKESLIHKADIALYEAKRTGKNKVVEYAPRLGKTLFGFKRKR